MLHNAFFHIHYIHYPLSIIIIIIHIRFFALG